ncbi:alanyl-tRNA editing protein [Halobacillus massiliensis]|uniref:alanyl-tRNA editing protein n=1 Tax=Halobacillus massiliensis TaxID=1926286 RepID=UPI0015C4956B|nr:DHHA1 domain-containing protein [Halobacillus massiliensis]
MTRKLYYIDPYQMEFESKVIKRDQDEHGFFLVLEETAFYPSGGGQPHDKGMLNGVKVIDVEEADGEVRHYIEESLPAETEIVRGIVDQKRRFDHMQQHNGQHIISAVFHDQFGIPTTSFHLGKETSTIDLDTEQLSADVMKAAEERVNEIILGNSPVETKWMSVEEAEKYPLRKSLAVDGKVRLVIIPHIDYNGCGGTHPRTTGEVRAVKFLGWTRSKKQVRLEFICGTRVLQKLEEKHEILTNMKKIIPRPEPQLVQEVEELVQAGKAKDKQIAELEEQLIHYEAQEIISASQGDKVIHRVFKDRSMQSLQTLGKSMVTEIEDSYIILISEQDEQLQFVLAHGEEIERNMNEVAKQVLPLIEGKGGGRPHFVQGGGRKVIDGEAFAEQVKSLL